MFQDQNTKQPHSIESVAFVMHCLKYYSGYLQALSWKFEFNISAYFIEFQQCDKFLRNIVNLIFCKETMQH